MKKIIRILMTLLCIALLTSLWAGQAFAATPAETKTNTLKPVPSIKVVAPKAGDSFNANSQTTVSWTYSNLAGTVRILLYKGGKPVSGFPLVSMTLSGSANISFPWMIDANTTPGNDYTIIVESNDKPGVKGTSATFTILPPKKSAPPKLSNPNELILPCPPTIGIRVYVQEEDYKNLPQEFSPRSYQNLKSDFPLFRTGRDSDTKCFCEYKGGDNIYASIFAKMNGYKRCTTHGNSELILYKQ